MRGAEPAKFLAPAGAADRPANLQDAPAALPGLRGGRRNAFSRMRKKNTKQIKRRSASARSRACALPARRARGFGAAHAW
jgi:hypothetical protein